MGRKKRKATRKSTKARRNDTTKPNRTESFLKFKETVEEELENAILRRMKAFRDKILESIIRKPK